MGELQSASRGPWVGGYTSAVTPFMARPDQLWGQTDGSDTNSSRDCLIDPYTGGISKRGGCSVINDTLDGGGGEVTGLLNKKWTAKCRKVFGLDTASMADGYPALSALYSNDTNAGFPTADVGFPGTIYVNSTNSGATTNALKNYSLLEEFVMGDTYGVPATEAAASDYLIRWVPTWYESGDGVYNRGALTGTAGTDKFMQQYLACGARSILQSQKWLYVGCLRANPWRWNKNFGESSTLATTARVNRGFPTGPWAPLWPPQYDTLPSASNGSSWLDGDTYYVSVLYQFEDGSYSLPFIPRAIQSSVLTSGLGLITVGTIGGTSKYPYVAYKNIPIGPEGTVARVLLRTPKQTRTAATDTITISPLDLRIIGVLRNNTQTKYLDYGGDDNSLLEDVDVVRFDWTLPRRSRYLGTGDQRAIASYTLPNTGAIMLAPCGVNANYDRNAADSSSDCYGSTASLVRITSTDLELHYNPGAAPTYDTAPTYSGTPGGNAVKFPFATYDSLEKLVDAINKTTFGSNCRQWAAQLAPGIDGTMPSASLTKTTLDIAVSTVLGFDALTGGASAFDPIGVGMKIKDAAGVKLTAGTYVLSKASATSITMSDVSIGNGAFTATFYQETGDNGIVTGGTVGYLRAFSGTLPLVLCMKPSAFPDYATPDKSSVYFTVASPGAATSGVSLAPNSWVAGNKRSPNASPRQQMGRACMGIVDIDGAAVVAYNDGIKIFANRRGANSGEDFDVRLFTANDTRGCVSPLALVSGNGWAAYATPEGIMAVDKNLREFSIGSDVFNPTDNKGDLAYEMGQALAASAADADDHHLSMGVFGSRLAVAFRNESTSIPRVLYYDFSPGVEASGVEELLNPETKRSYVWSPPAMYNSTASLTYIGAMGSVVQSSGRIDVVSFDSNAGTGDGRLDKVGLTSTPNDNGYAVNSTAVMAPFMASDMKKLSPQRMEVTHVRPDATSGTSAIEMANDQVPTFSVALQRALPANASLGFVQRQVIPLDQGQRGAVTSGMFWTRWRNNIAVLSSRIWRLVLEYDELDT